MRKYLEEHPCECDGCSELMGIQEQGAAQVLGLVKKLSVHHHFKLMETLI